MLPSVVASGLEQAGQDAIHTAFHPIAVMTSATDESMIISDNLPLEPVERTIAYESPFDRCDRVEDYRTAWAFFEKQGASA